MADEFVAYLKNKLRADEENEESYAMITMGMSNDEVENYAYTKVMKWYQYPPCVKRLHVTCPGFTTQALRDIIIQVIMSGPSNIDISKWPRGETTLFEALLRKRDLDRLHIGDVAFCDPHLLARLAGKVKRLSLYFDDNEEDPDRWVELGHAVTTSATLERLKLSGHVPRTAFPSHLPVNMQTFKVDCEGESTIPYGWLYHDYWPRKMQSLKLSCTKGSSHALDLSRTITRLRDLESLQLFDGSGYEIMELISRVLSEKNHIERIGMRCRWSLPLAEILESEHALMKRLVLKSEWFTDKCCKEIRELVRGHTRVDNLTLIGTEQYSYKYTIYDDWFHVMEALFSAREVPRISACSHVKMLPLRDMMPRIAATLGWPLSELTN